MIERIKQIEPAKVLALGHMVDNETASHFYKSLGFVYTGNQLAAGDLEMVLRFDE